MTQSGAEFDVSPILNTENRARLRELAAALRASQHFVGAQWQDDADWLDKLGAEPRWRPFYVYVHDGDYFRGPVDEIFTNSAEGAIGIIVRSWPVDAGDRFQIVPVEPDSIYDRVRDITLTEKRELRYYDSGER